MVPSGESDLGANACSPCAEFGNRFGRKRDGTSQGRLTTATSPVTVIIDRIPSLRLARHGGRQMTARVREAAMMPPYGLATEAAPSQRPRRDHFAILARDGLTREDDDRRSFRRAMWSSSRIARAAFATQGRIAYESSSDHCPIERRS